MSGKIELPINEPQTQSSEPRTPTQRKVRISAATLLLLPLLWLLATSGPKFPLPSLSSLGGCSHSSPVYTAAQLAQAKCPAQPPALNVGSNWNPSEDDAFAHLAAKRLSSAVQIDTVSFDDLPLNVSHPAFDKHHKFSKFLEEEYPKLFKAPMSHEYVNTHGHLFTWPGKNKDLPPILLMAHIDTVPVLQATLGQWTFPPFEGKISVNATKDTPGTWIWGRGSSDCKNSLLGIYNAVEKLIDEGFEPERTILIGNGFDEEVSQRKRSVGSQRLRAGTDFQIGGIRGAAKVAERIKDTYGEQSLAFLVDEGFSGISHEYGRTFASFGMAEKGSVNVDIKVEALGGHSSVPPAHTASESIRRSESTADDAVGVTSLILAELEANPFEPVLDPRGPYIKYLSCLADHAPDFPKKIKQGVRNPKKWKKLAKELAAGDRIVNSFLATTQAIDLINGGVKVNALPEVVTCELHLLSRRIMLICSYCQPPYFIVSRWRNGQRFRSRLMNSTSNVEETLEHVQKTVEPLIRSLNYTLSGFDDDHAKKASPFHVTLSVPGGGRGARGLEPAPITSPEDPSFAFLAGTTKAVFGDDVVVAPTGMYGGSSGLTVETS
jgi:Gly-Xaa carboxypeptidase